MKKFLLIGAMSIFGMTSAQFKYGVKAGYNLSNISVSSPAISAQALLGNRSGFYVGGVAEYGFGNNLSIQGEVLYNNLGARVNADFSKIPNTYNNLLVDFDLNGANKGKGNITLHEISVPFSLKYSFDKFSVLGGFNLNFITGIKTKAEVDGVDVKAIFEREEGINIDSFAKNYLATVDFGLHVGAEYTFSNRIFIDGKYNFGLSSLNKNFNDLVTAKQRFFQLGVGYKFK